MRRFAAWIHNATKYVVSSSLGSSDWNGTRILPTFVPAQVEALKGEPGPDIMVFGSGTIVTQLAEHGLVDEYQLIMSPILLGAGQPLFGETARRTRLELLEARGWPNGNVMLRYAPKG